MTLVTKFQVKQCHTMRYVILAQIFAMPPPQTINPPPSHIRLVWSHEFKLKKNETYFIRFASALSQQNAIK